MANQLEDQKLVFKTDYPLMQVKSIAILSTCIKLPFVIKIFVLSMFGWLLKTGFTVLHFCVLQHMTREGSGSHILMTPRTAQDLMNIHEKKMCNKLFRV